MDRSRGILVFQRLDDLVHRIQGFEQIIAGVVINLARLVDDRGLAIEQRKPVYLLTLALI